MHLVENPSIHTVSNKASTAVPVGCRGIGSVHCHTGYYNILTINQHPEFYFNYREYFTKSPFQYGHLKINNNQ